MAKKDEFPIHVPDFLIDVSEFSIPEIGVYTMLLMTQFKNKSLPMEMDRLASMVGIAEEQFLPVWEKIKGKFIEHEGRYINLRTEQTRAKVQKEAFYRGSAGSSGGKGKKEHKLVYPWDTPKFKEHWELWLRYKKDTYKFEYKTEISQQGALDSLRTLTSSEKQACELILYAIKEQWKGIWMPRDWKPIKNEIKEGTDYGNL